MASTELGVRVELTSPDAGATPSDARGIARTLALAFENDPLWSWAFPGAGRVESLERLWGHYVDNALRYPWTFTSGVYEAACVWIPPGGTELSKEGEAELEPLVSELSGGDPGPVLALCEALEAAHPRVAPHFYLSLLGTHPQSRGRGLGMGIIRGVLERIDAEHMPAYLESSLPDNDRRYASGRLRAHRRSQRTGQPDGHHDVARGALSLRGWGA